MDRAAEAMSFEKFSAARRRQQSARESSAAEAAAAAAAVGAPPGTTSGTLPPAALVSPTGPADDAFRSSLATKQAFLLVVLLDLACVLFELVYGLHGAEAEAALGAAANPTMPKLLLPALRAFRTGMGYAAWAIWLVSFGEAVVYAVAAWEARRVVWLRVVDAAAVLAHGALLALRAPLGA